jgi:hypothetical protein
MVANAMRLLYILGTNIVLLPGFQKGRLGKRAGSILAKKGQFASYKEKLEKFRQNFTTFRVNKMFSHKF